MKTSDNHRLLNVQFPRIERPMDFGGICLEVAWDGSRIHSLNADE